MYKDTERLTINYWNGYQLPMLKEIDFDFNSDNLYTRFIVNSKITNFSVAFIDAFIDHCLNKNNTNNTNKNMEFTNPTIKKFEELLSSREYVTNDMAYTMMYNELNLKEWSLQDKLILHIFLADTQVRADKANAGDANEFRTKLINEIDELLKDVDYESQLRTVGDLMEFHFFELFFNEKLEKYEDSKV